MQCPANAQGKPWRMPKDPGPDPMWEIWMQLLFALQTGILSNLLGHLRGIKTLQETRGPPLPVDNVDWRQERPPAPAGLQRCPGHPAAGV